MKRPLLTFAALAASAAVSQGATIVTAYGTIAGVDDANQAGPMFGQGITVDVGTATPAIEIPATVYLQQLSFQSTSSTTGVGTGSVYIHVYDSFAVDGDDTPSEIGNLVAVSSTTVDLDSVTPNQTLTWLFNFEAISSSSTYQYVLAENTQPATVEDSSNLATNGFELNTGDPYTGGQAYRANGTTNDWDMEFELSTSDVVPEPSVVLLGGLGVLGLLRRRRN